MNIYAEIAAKYLSVAQSHEYLAEKYRQQADATGGAWAFHRDKAESHLSRAANARMWSQHYSRLAHDVNDREAAAHDEETCRHADH